MGMLPYTWINVLWRDPSQVLHDIVKKEMAKNTLSLSLLFRQSTAAEESLHF